MILNSKKAQAQPPPPDQGGNFPPSGGFRINRRNRNKK